jgi:hypothetical protein
MALASAITKQIDASWSVGDNAGGLDTGSVASDTTYFLWAIKRSDTSVVDALFSTSATSPTMPTSYDLKRLIGAVVTDGSANIIGFHMHGVADHIEVYWNSIIMDVNKTVGTTGTLETLTVPSGIPVKAEFRIGKAAAPNTAVLATSGLGNDDALGGTSYNVEPSGELVTQYGTRMVMTAWTNSSGQIRLRATGNTGTAVHTYGWSFYR